MNVVFTDSFSKSLKTLIRHQTWWYKTYSAIRWDIPAFLKNVWRFRKELYNHRWWDYRFTLEMLYRSLSIIEKGISEKGIEVDETRNLKVIKMRRALELLKHKLDDDYILRAESEFGRLIMHDWDFEDMGDGSSKLIDKDTDVEREHNKKIFDRANEIEETEWNELWNIFKGNPFTKIKEFDGSDMRGWWD